MQVPFLDLGAAVAEQRDELDAAYRRVLDSGWFLLGAEAEAFEREFAQARGVQHAVVVATGLDALVLSLRALGVGSGDEVIVPGFTFIATWLAVTATGATPVPVDVDDATANLDPDLVEAALTSRTRAIVPVHLQGDRPRCRDWPRSPTATISAWWRMPPRPTWLGTAARSSAAWGARALSASTRARTSARSATAVR